MGLRYTQFHSTALCSPTRAALITGRNHHSVGFGNIGELSTGYPAYDSIIGPENATIGEILKEYGFAASWFGKNHNTPAYQYSAAGPFDQWPSGMGFEYFYGFMGGETDQWQPYLFRDHTQIFSHGALLRLRPSKLSRCDAESPTEMTREMALVGKAYGVCDLRQ
jgi:arylsulfatase A-like enzyme